MSEARNKIDDTIDLAMLMRPFLNGKNGAVVMATLCLLMAEAITVINDLKVRDKTVDYVSACVRGYIEQIERVANDPA